MTSFDSGHGVGGFSIQKDEVGSSSFDLFKKVEINTSIVSAPFVYVRPITTSSSKGPFDFIIPADPIHWTDAETMRLSGKVRLTKNVGGVPTIMAADDDCSVVNNFFHSLFKSVNVKLNQTELSDPSQKW